MTTKDSSETLSGVTESHRGKQQPQIVDLSDEELAQEISRRKQDVAETSVVAQLKLEKTSAGLFLRQRF